MHSSIKYGPRGWRNGERISAFLLLLLCCSLALTGCGGSSSSNSPDATLIPPNLSGNWQFTMSPPTDGSFVGGLQGGFLLQNNGSVSGGATYSFSLTSFSIPCNRGSATLTGTINGQEVTLSGAAGKQTFTLTGTLSLDGLTMSGTYNVTAGQASDGSPCGAAQTGLQWAATLVPTLTGPIQGTFQSGGGPAGLNEQEFALTGVLSQGANTGGSSSTVTGNLSFINPVTNTSSYRCFGFASVNGQISGTSLTLEITGSSGSEWGLIGEPVGSTGETGLGTVTLTSVKGGYALQGDGTSYLVANASCPGSLGSITTAGDYGNVCLTNSSNACQQPINLIPSGLSFSSKSSQSIILANSTNDILLGVTLSLTNDSGATNFTETDLCGPGGTASQGKPFNFNPQQTCTVTVAFAPQETCTQGGSQGECPSPVTATLMIAVPSSNTIITAPITGPATHSASTRQSDFGLKNRLDASRQFAIPPEPSRISDDRYDTLLRFARCGASCRD